MPSPRAQADPDVDAMVADWAAMAGLEDEEEQAPPGEDPETALASGWANALLRAVPKTQAMTWRSKRLADVNSAASKVIMRDMIVLPS
jgi:hypothetical protein